MQTKHKIPNKRAHTHKLKKGMQGGGGILPPSQEVDGKLVFRLELADTF